MPPYDLVRSILMRAHVQNPCPSSATPALPQPGPPIPGPSQPDVYNPVTAHYEDVSPAYSPPVPWFEGVPTTGTPAVPSGSPAEARVEPDQAQYSDAVMDQQLFNALMQVAVDAGAVPEPASIALQGLATDAPPDPYAVSEQVQPEPDPVAVANAVFDYQMQAAATAEAPPQEQPDPASPLEQMVEQMFQQMMDAGMLATPEMMGPGMPMCPGMGPM